MILQSRITYPHCAAAKMETMPTDACQFFYECSGCGVKLRPKPGDCCVFCSYGSVPCPPMQAERSGETSAARLMLCRLKTFQRAIASKHRVTSWQTRGRTHWRGGFRRSL
jgi:hypothetical protein